MASFRRFQSKVAGLVRIFDILIFLAPRVQSGQESYLYFLAVPAMTMEALVLVQTNYPQEVIGCASNQRDTCATIKEWSGFFREAEMWSITSLIKHPPWA